MLVVTDSAGSMEGNVNVAALKKTLAMVSISVQGVWLSVEALLGVNWTSYDGELTLARPSIMSFTLPFATIVLCICVRALSTARRCQ